MNAQFLKPVLDLWRTPVFIVSAAGLIVHLNEAASLFLSRAGALRSSGGRLAAAGTVDTAKLLGQIARVTSADRQDTDTTCLISAAGGGRFAALLFALDGEGGAGEPAGHVLLAMFDLRDAAISVPGGVLTALFGLTEAEERIARLVAAGNSPADIAEKYGLSMPTIRTHLSRIYQKTETATQRSLMRLLASLGMFGRAQPDGEGR